MRQQEQRRGQDFPQRPQNRPSDRVKQRIDELSSGLSQYPAQQLVEDAEKLAGEIRDLKTAQIRKIYGTVKKLEMDFKTGDFDHEAVVLLRPKLAYAANREGKVRPLKDVLDACIGQIREGEEGRKDFQRFVDFFEAVLAYHRG